jgi:hypothetical protein
MRRNGRYGRFGKHIELFEMFESWRDDPDAQAALAVEEGWIEESDEAQASYRESLAEASGTGAPEGRADFPLYMLTVTRHKMREGFRRRAAQWERYVGTERAEDFRQHTVSQLNGLTGMGPVPEFDEYPRIRSAEEMGPPYSVGKHGGVYALTYEMIVNDDTNLILNRTPRELGRMSAAYVSLVVVGLIESNPNWIDGLPFFTATARQGLPAGNEFSGAAAEPSEDNLITIIASLKTAVDAEGFPMEIDPGVIITKDERTKYIFRRIIRSQQTGAVANDTSTSTFDKGTANAAEGILPEDGVIVEPYLRDPNDWILLADIGRPAFIIAFLRDQREPFIGLQDPGVRSFGGGRDPYTLDADEIPMKIRHVFGVALGDPRAARRARRS